MTENLIIPGQSIFYRLGQHRRTGQVYFSPDMILREFNRYASARDGKIVVPINRSVTPEYFLEPDGQHLIIWSPRTSKALIGSIDASERDYDPNHPPHIKGYGIPEPWNMIPARVWVAISDVQLVDFDVTAYQTEPNTGKPLPLEQAVQRSGTAVQRIRPKDDVALSF